jgi:cell shape-determining protein MreD
VKQAALLFAAGLAALLLQSALAVVVPPPFVPDLGLLVVIAIGLFWEPLPSGFALAAGLGYATDVLSGSLLGQHGLLRLLSFAAARLGGRQLNLRGPLPLAMFAAGLTVVYAAALQGVLAFFTGSAAELAAQFGRTFIHALSNAIAAPFVAIAVEWLCTWAGDDEASRRGVRLDAGPAR